MTPQTMETEFSGTLEHKVEKLIFFATRHSFVVQQSLENTASLALRVKALEEDQNRRDLADERARGQMEAMLTEIKYVKDTLKGVRGVLTKALWIIAGAVLLAATNWVMTGGLKL
jgi:hypothetical protein